MRGASGERRAARVGDAGAFARVVLGLSPDGDVGRRRRLLAEFIRMLGTHVGKPPTTPADDPELSPRLRQTLLRLLDGDSEKQIAGRLGISRHTVHIYVKALYKHFRVSSRGELMARCLK